MPKNGSKSKKANKIEKETLENVENVEVETLETPETQEPPQFETDGKAEYEARAKQRKVNWIVRDIFEWGETLISAVLIIVIIFTFALRITSVDGASMNPTLHDQDRMLVNNFFYTPRRGDIVVIHSPHLFCSTTEEFGRDIIKRVIALPGDTISIGARQGGTGLVYLNGEPLEINETGLQMLESGYTISGLTYADPPIVNLTIPEGHVFVLGDNRGSSMDSRISDTEARSGAVGLVNINHIAGKAFFRIAGSGSYHDSFFSAFGFVS